MTWVANALAVLSSIAYGAADFLGGLATKRGSTVFSAVVWSQATGLLVVLLALPFLPPASPTTTDVAWGAASGLAGGIGLAFLYHGLAIGVMSVVAPVTAVCAVIIPVAVGVALGERPTGVAVAGVGLALVAIVLISQSGQVEEGKDARTGVGIAVVSGIAIGIFLVCLQRTGRSAGLWPLVPARVVSVSFFAVAGLLAREKLLPRRESWPIVVGGGALDMVANIFYLLAVRQGPLSIVATLTSLYPAGTILLARIVLRERLRFVQLAGVACAVLAIVLIVSG
ncbi:MAG TPA: DMT family transporter [Thermoanaerobaculia bacterium]|jgi:drug/metabolite transporter (DMT)-like permease|nr:DMT family transporter [Thermoanaerobaculia bacterium]